MNVRQLIDNRAKDGNPYERMLGSVQAVNAVAEFQEKHPGLIQLLATNALIEFCKEETFSNVEYARFAKGIATIGAEFQACWQERQDIINQGLPPDSEESESEGSP